VRLRLFNVFGPRQDAASPYAGVVARFVGALCEGRTPAIHGDGSQSRDFTYVANAVDALLLAAQAPGAVGNVYNVGGGGRVSVENLLRHLGALLDREFRAAYRAARPGDVRHSQADLTRARRDLGYEPRVAFPDGLRRTLEVYQSCASRRLPSPDQTVG
jgi:UDP-glucose 4-epimerase